MESKDDASTKNDDLENEVLKNAVVVKDDADGKSVVVNRSRGKPLQLKPNASLRSRNVVE